MGTQLFNIGKMDESIVWLERAYQKRPGTADFALNLAQAYMVKGDTQEIESLSLPFLSQEQVAKYELFFLLGRAYQKSGKLDKAIEIFDKTISHYGTNMNILNAVGECYFQKGDYRAALVVWEKSLEIDPDQPQIRKNVEALKEKK